MMYREKYNELIEYRKKFQPPTTAYTEKHHILPKSCGGTNDPENLVVLTGAEHFKAHYYLAKAMKEENDPNYKNMMFALVRMKQQIVKKSDLTDSQIEELGKIYEEVRSEFREAVSEVRKGKHLSEEAKMKLREINTGKHPSEETRRKMSEALKGNKRTFGHHHSEETRRKMSEAIKKSLSSEETKQKLSKANKGDKNPAYGKHWYNDGSKNVRAKECPEGFVPGKLIHAQL